MARNRTLEAIVSIAGQLDPSLARSIGNAQKQFGGLQVGIAAISTVAVAATAAVVKFGEDAAKSAAEFETQMANVSTLLDGTQEQVAKRINELSDDVLTVSNNTGVATDELSDGLYQIISAVGDSEDAITQMELAAKAAAAGGATTTDAINLLTAVTKGYGDTSGEAFQKAADLSFMTVKLGQTSFPELASSIGDVIPYASTLGVKQEEVYGAFAALTGVTGNTAKVATQMKNVMLGLSSPTKDMTKALKSLGYSNANAALESLGLQGTLEALAETVGGDTDALAQMFSSAEAKAAILGLAGAQAEDFATKTEAMYQASGATQTAFERQTDTLEYTIQTIKNLGKNFMTSVGRVILPVVKEVAQKLLPVIQEGLESLQPVMENLYTALSPVIGIVGDFIAGLIPKFQSNIELMGTAWGELQPVISDLAEQIFPVLQSVMDNVRGLFEDIAPTLSSIASGILPTLGTMVQDIVPILSDLAQQIFPIFKMVLDDVLGLFEDIAPTIATFVSNLIPALGAVLQAIIPIIRVVAQALGPIFSMIGQLVNSLLPAITSLINFLVPIIQMAADIISVTLGNLFEFILPILQNIIGAISGLCDFIANVFTGNWEGAWEAVKSIFGNCFEAIVGLAKQPINSIIQIINNLISGINGMGFTIPDWVPVVGGQKFELQIPEIPLFASGGFTQGPSIAGEEATEAIISFDPAYRNENLSYWAKAGRMLGADDTLLNSFTSQESKTEININVDFSPHIEINGSENVEYDIMNALRREEEELIDMLEDMLNRRGGDLYKASFG